MKRWKLGLVIIAVLGLNATPSLADAKARAVVRDAAYEEKLRMLSPEAADEWHAASADPTPANALPHYEAVNRLEPSFIPAMRRRGVILVALGRRADGLRLLRRAVELDESEDTRASLARGLATAGPDAKPPVDDVHEALDIMRDVATQVPDDIDHQLTYCRVALAAQSPNDLQTCSQRIRTLDPLDPEGHTFASIAALAHGDRDGARQEAEKAKDRGLDPQRAAALDEVIVETEAPLYKWGRRLGYVVGAWLGVLALLFGLGTLFSRRTLAISEELATNRDEDHPPSAALRSWYRALLNLAGAYYYASLPFVLVLSVLAGAAVILGLLYVGHIPIYIVLVTLTIVAYTVKAIITSLVIRARDVEPGLAVDLEKHTALAAVLREVADRVGTRPVDEVYLTANTDIAVAERGGLGAQMRGRSERCLILGVGVLSGMKLQSFKAILAHEYGHFSNEDTAGGSMAFRVRRSLITTALGLAKGGAATFYNPAWLFVVGFHKVFLRISQGASRLQEVLADRIAARAYGGEAFATGLTHVIRRELELEDHVRLTLKEVLEGGRPLANLYAYTPAPEEDPTDIEAKLKTLIEKEPSPYDSHPRPKDRMRWVRRLKSSLAPPPPAESEEMAWDLFVGRETIERRLTDEVRGNLAMRGIRLLAEAPSKDVAAA